MREGNDTGEITLWCPANDGVSMTKKSIERGVNVLQKWGYKINIPENTFSNHSLLGITSKKFSEKILENYIFSRSSNILLSIYGGYTTNLLLELIPERNKIADKLFCGKSDITCFLNGIFALTNLKSVYGIDFSKISNPYISKQELETLKCVLKKETISFQKPQSYNDGYWYLNSPQNFKSKSWKVISSDPVNNALSGISVGGNLESLTTLIGTPYMPDFKNMMLVIESVSDVSPPKFIMNLKSLAMGTNLVDAKAIIIGTFAPNSILNEPAIISQILFEEIGLSHLPPVVTNVDISHTEPSYPFYIGGQLELDIRKNSMMISWR